VGNTAEIGPVVVLKIRSEGKRNKRVTIGFAGEAAA
jgi:Ser-tRNA(Ala) deacylase AlaX